MSTIETNRSWTHFRVDSTTGPPGSGPRKAVVVINSRIVGKQEVIQKRASGH
jgi:hypothetical protein